MKKSILAMAALAAIITTPARATGLIAGATFPEQIVQELTLVQQYIAQAQQLQEQYQMVYNQAQNLENMPEQLWTNASGSLQQLVQLVGNAQGLSYASQNTVAAIQQQFGAPNAALSNYAQSLSQWTDNLDHQIAGVLQQYDLSSSNFQSTQSALQAIQNASQSASGRMQVLQAGNQISGLMVNQLQSLQADIQAGNQAQLNALSLIAHSKDDATQADTETLNAPIQPGGF
ncbi:MAG: P-type conjugative transfer protein TrbJ [Betaproteobacteria bacterium]|nr:P-type conjugative transfer protein TrbJ [Betaproteobacteria bacterium]